MDTLQHLMTSLQAARVQYSVIGIILLTLKCLYMGKVRKLHLNCLSDLSVFLALKTNKNVNGLVNPKEEV